MDLRLIMDNQPFTFGSLFSGIGGLDLGLERAGMQCAWQVEIDDYATKVLQKHWPNVTRFRDVRACGEHNLAPVDLIAGGFPCQDISDAGKQAGIEGERSGLWAEFYRIICELRPRFVLVENVAALLHRGMGRVLGDLAAGGYDAEWQILSAESIGAPHLRERVFIVAYPSGTKWGQSPEEWRYVTDWTDAGWQEAASGFEFCGETLANTYSDGWGWTQRTGTRSMVGTCGKDAEREGYPQWDAAQCGSEMAHADFQSLEVGQCLTGNSFTQCTPFERGSYFSEQGATQSRMGRATYGLPSWLDGYQWPAGPGVEQYEWEAPRVTTEKVANRTARLKGLGNAVLVALAESVGRCIMAAEMAEKQVLA